MSREDSASSLSSIHQSASPVRPIARCVLVRAHWWDADSLKDCPPFANPRWCAGACAASVTRFARAMAFSLAAFPASSTHVHLIGVAGSGMSGLAWLFLQRGYRVSGCDRATSAETERLRQAGLDFFCPQTAESVRGADLVVYTSAVSAGNPAFDAAIAAGVPVWRRAEALAAIMHGKKGIVICGTHGKTTTSAMTAHRPA